MKRIVIFSTLATVWLAITASAASAQDLSMCTATFPVARCKASYAKYGPFGSAHGNTEAARMAELQACQARKAKR